MRCDDFQRRWQALLDERQLPEQDEQLCDHAAQCDDCREVLSIQALLFREVARSRNSPLTRRPSAHSLVKLAATAPAQLPSPVQVRTGFSTAKLLFGGLAVAASLAIVILPAWRLSSSSISRSPRPNQFAHANSRGKPSTLWVAKAPESSSDPTVTSRHVQQSDSDRAALEQAAVRQFMYDVAAKLTDVPQDRLEPLDRIAGGFRPLANT